MLTPAGRAFYEEYRKTIVRMAAAAAAAEDLVSRALEEGRFDLHLVAARAKEPRSLLKKLRDKGYDNPAAQLTDQVGVRVITYYDDQVPRIVERLKDAFEVSPEHSRNPTEELGPHEFGYRSDHLVVRAELDDLAGSQAQGLKGLWFEIQVRSVLAHAWAEIEHEVNYKSGVTLPEELGRRFDRMAAELEELDSKFKELRDARDQLVDTYLETYRRGDELDEPLDVARLLAALEALRPDGFSFRRAFAEGASFAQHIEAICRDALEAGGISTAKDLNSALNDDECSAVIESYASLIDVAPGEVSHFAIAVIAAAYKDATDFAEQFPDLLEDDVLAQALLRDEGDDGSAEEGDAEEESPAKSDDKR